MTCNHTTATTDSIAATTFSSLQQTQLLLGRAAIDKTWLCTQPTKRPNFLFSPVPFSSLLLSSLYLSLSLSCLVFSPLLSSPFIFFSSVRHAMSWTLHLTPIPYQPFGLTSSTVCIYEASTILSTLETDLWYWVVVGCGAEEETDGLCPNCWRNWMQNFTGREREWRIWTFFSVSCLRVFILLSWRCSNDWW